MNVLRRAAGKLGEAIGLPVSGGPTGVDTALDAYRERLNIINEQMAAAKQTAHSYCKVLIHSVHSSRLLAEEFSALYANNTAAAQEVGLTAYQAAAHRIEAHASSGFKQKIGWELLKLFDDYADESASLASQLSGAFAALEQLNKADSQYGAFKAARDKRSQRGQELTPKEELMMKSSEDQLAKFVRGYKEIREELEEAMKKFFAKRVDVLNEIYARFAEFQYEFLQYELSQLKGPKDVVDAYRRSHPRAATAAVHDEQHEAATHERSYSVYKAESKHSHHAPSNSQSHSRSTHSHTHSHSQSSGRPAMERKSSEYDEISGSDESDEEEEASEKDEDDLEESDHQVEEELKHIKITKDKSSSDRKDNGAAARAKSASPSSANSSHVDFLGLGTGPAPSPVPEPRSVAPKLAPVVSSPMDDFFGFSAAAAPAKSAPPSVSHSASTPDFNFFASSTPAPAPAAAAAPSNNSFEFLSSINESLPANTRPASASTSAAAAPAQPAPRPRTNTEAPKLTNASVAKVANDAANEKIAFIRETEAAHIAEQSAKRDAAHSLEYTLSTWEAKDGTKKSIRTLLSTLHSVLWPGSGWKQLSVADLIDFNAIKKAHRKAILIVHPDKLIDATPEQKVIAERLFDSLNTAFERYQETGQ